MERRELYGLVIMRAVAATVRALVDQLGGSNRLKRDPLPPLQGESSGARCVDAGRAFATANRPGVGNALLAAFVLGTLVCVGVAVAVSRSFYGDGAYAVLGLLAKPMHYIDYDFHRSFASFIGQTPVLLGQRVGLTSVSAYGGLYTFAIDGLPLLAYVMALVLARNEPRVFAATALALAVFGFAGNFTNSEGNLFLGLAWLAGVVLALPGRRRFARGIVLPVLAFALLRIYEGMLLAGPVLAGWAYVRARRTDDLDEKVGLVLATLLFAIACAIGFSGYVAPRDAGNFANFASSTFAYLRNPQRWLLFASGCILVAVFCRSLPTAIGATLVAVVLALVFAADMVGLQGYGAYRIYYQNRAFVVLLMPIALAALAIADLYGNGRLTGSVDPARMLALLVPFAAVVAIDLLGSARWLAYMNAFCGVLDEPATASTGVARLKASGAVTGWHWTHPSLSLLLRRHDSTAIVPNEPGNWEPFDPAGMALARYRGACENRRFGRPREAASP